MSAAFAFVALVFWVVAALLVFTYAGYPLLTIALARLRPRPLARAAVPPPAVSVILCAYDAQALVATKLRNLLVLEHPVEQLEVVVACDGCSDDTAQACRDLGDARVRVLEFGQRRGKAACLNDAVAEARGDVLLMVDVRQRIDRNALRRLLECLSDPGVGAASGELCFESPDAGFARSVDAYWRYEKLIRQAESRSGSVVGVTGALYVMRRSLFKPIPPGTVLDDVLLPMQVIASGFRVVFEPGALAWDAASQSPGQERKRKVRTLAGNLQLLAIAPWLLDPRANPAWIRFTCHKLLRLAAPWLLCALIVSTLLLAPRHPFYLACACAAAVAALVLLVGSVIPWLSGTWPVRLLSAFWHMNLYAAQALVAYVRNPRLHLW
ncbi:glycosyltransferase family 2 protein [Luteimonas mephitis]|uniref:glycosyltransferase family 2 protein n=1 Tax=Luteimonas mephitis TaxID=83615 RepID=UPI003A8EE7A2